MREMQEKMDGGAGQGAEEVGGAAGWGKSALSGSGEVGEESECALWREELPAGQCELISSHHLLQCSRA